MTSRQTEAHPLYLLTATLLFLLFFPSCKEESPTLWNKSNSLKSVTSPPICDRGEAAPLLRAIDYSLKYLSTGKTEETIQMGERHIPLAYLAATLEDFKDRLQRDGLGPKLFQYLRDHYEFYSPPVESALITGYYEAQLNGSKKPSPKYAHPIYRTPRDMIKIDLSKFYFFPAHEGLPPLLRGRLSNDGRIRPYYTREEIDALGCLRGRGLELLWIDNPVDLFFLHVQGSGVVVFEDGGRQRIGYDGSNGHPYRAIGRVLIERGVLTYQNMSMQSIRKYLRRHPEEMQGLFNENPSYIFFRFQPTGPLGSTDVPVTPFRSVATDPRLFPPGALCYLRTELPLPDSDGGDGEPYSEEFCGFVLNQDSGGAIRGPARLDLFTGVGPRSEWIAGHMKQRGTFYFLIKKAN